MQRMAVTTSGSEHNFWQQLSARAAPSAAW